MQQTIDAVFHPVCHPECTFSHLYEQREGGRGLALQHTLLCPSVSSLLITYTKTGFHWHNIIPLLPRMAR